MGVVNPLRAGPRGLHILNHVLDLSRRSKCFRCLKSEPDMAICTPARLSGTHTVSKKLKRWFGQFFWRTKTAAGIVNAYLLDGACKACAMIELNISMEPFYNRLWHIQSTRAQEG